MTAPAPPLDAIRVVELSRGLAARTTGRLLADLGADVVRVVPSDPLADGFDPETLCGDRGKRFAIGDADVLLPGLLGDADVLVLDLGPTELRSRGLDEATLRMSYERLIHAWMPPYGTTGRWSDLDPDPLLLSALSGFASHFPATEERPVAPVIPAPTYLQGAFGAAAAVAALAGRDRDERAMSFSVSGLQACASLLLALMFEPLDVPVATPPAKSLRAGPYFRLYRGGDGQWFFLGALSPEIFIRALEVLDRLELMVVPGADGEFLNLTKPEVNAVVGGELERLFASAPAAEWVARLQAGSVPAALAFDRDAWLDNPIVSDNELRFETVHPEVGRVVMPGVPLLLDGHAPTPGALPTRSAGNGTTVVWKARSVDAPTAAKAAVPQLPFAGLRVIDLTTFYAGPIAGALLAEYGADVIKVESQHGDPYRIFSVPHLVINKRKRIIALDLHSKPGMEALVRLLETADVMLDNFRPAIRERLGLTEARLREINPRLVHANLTAYGQARGAAELPGFDPVLQTLSGMVKAQGGDGDPVNVGAPVNDLAAGGLITLGVAVGLFLRGRRGVPVSSATSLAAAATFLQSNELTRFAGRVPAPMGGTDHPGRSPGNRYYRTADGWIAIAAHGTEQERAFLALAASDVSDALAASDGDVEAAMLRRTASEWISVFTSAGIASCPVLARDNELDDEFLTENEYTEIHHHPDFGRVRGMRAYSDWVGLTLLPGRAGGPVGADTAEVLAECGITLPAPGNTQQP